MSQPIIFYDLDSNLADKAWSPNTWKTRHILNFKGLPYRTVWVPGSNIAAVAKSVGAPATDKNVDGSPFYTCPFIQDPNTGNVITDSALIADHLETTYPDTTPIFPKHSKALQMSFQVSIRHTILMPLVCLLSLPSLEILSPEDQKWYRSAREAWLGIKVEEISSPGDKREGHFNELQEGLGMIDDCWLMWAKRTMAAEEWDVIAGWHGGRWVLLMERLEQYEVAEI